eukprot:scaffold31607_cov57-Phaeocystis_antarctica.AAC.4
MLLSRSCGGLGILAAWSTVCALLPLVCDTLTVCVSVTHRWEVLAGEFCNSFHRAPRANSYFITVVLAARFSIYLSIYTPPLERSRSSAAARGAAVRVRPSIAPLHLTCLLLPAWRSVV